LQTETSTLYDPIVLSTGRFTVRTGHYVDPDARDHFRRAYKAAAARAPLHCAEDVDTPFGTVRVRRFLARRPDGTLAAPLVLLPGTGAPGLVFADLVPALSERREVLLVDALGGPGGSHQEVPLRRFADQVEWLTAMLDGLELGAFHLTGASMGGRIALGLGVAGHPGLRSLALLDPVAAFSRIPLSAIAVALGALPRAPVWWRRRFLEVVGDDPTVGANPEAALFAAGLGRFAAAMPQPSVATGAELAAVSVPTLVVLGGRSALLDAEQARRRAVAGLRDARVEVWPKATHALLSANPPRLVAALLAHADTADDRIASDTQAGSQPPKPGKS